ncbi:MAG: fatty acid--CoA ligase family protein [Pseudomonadota bacterium]|nr:fatty acid--CoA ligase family protein [Pseudomonadota bacterium]
MIQASTNKLQELSAAALNRPPTQPVIEFERRWHTAGEMREVADRLTALLEASTATDTAIAFMPRNRPSAIAAMLGMIASGRTMRMLYAFQSAAAIARDLERLKPAVFVAAMEDFSPEVLLALETFGIAGIALIEMNAVAVRGYERTQLVQESPRNTHPQIEILTSGTTGPPKQFVISYDMISRHLIGSGDLSSLPPTVLFFPLGNISGLYSTLPAMLRGQRAVLLDRFSVAGWHDYVLRYQPEASGLPPAGVQMVLDAQIPQEDLACIRRLGTGAAPLDPTAHRAFEQRYGIPILLSYGATEFGGPVAAMTAELHAQWGQKKFGSVGRALPGAQLRIIDTDSGTILPPGSEGLLEVISPRMGPDWIRTSDIGVIDDDGFLFHRGRADGAIMRGGFKLLPETVENALMQHPAVSASAVVGLADARLGQVPAAAIQFKPGVEQPSVAALEAHLRTLIYATHIPVTWRFVDELPRTPSLKVDRPALRRLFENG